MVMWSKIFDPDHRRNFPNNQGKMVKILNGNIAKYFAIYFDYKMPICSL